MRSLIVLGALGLSFFAAVPAFAADGGLSAVDDSVVAEKKVIQIDVLANDIAGGAKIDTSTLRIASDPSSGEAVVIASGSPKVKYTAAGSEAQVDAFTYTICDGDGVCASATATVNFLGEIDTTTTTLTPTTTSPTTDTFPAPPPPVTTVPAQPAVPAPATTTTTQTNGTSTATTLPLAVPPTTTTAPARNVHALAELALASEDRRAAGTTLGESRGVKLDEDVAYLGRSGLDTLALVATPALMVSGIVGFLMIGLPQNAFGLLFGVLAGRRRKEKSQAKGKPGSPHPNP